MSDGANLWLALIKEPFCEMGQGGQDFFYLLEQMIGENKMTFPHLLSNATHGNGCTVHEGLSYSLDQDWDDPRAFDEVVFFIGDMESASLSVMEYLNLIDIACEKYTDIFAEDREHVLDMRKRISVRYSGYHGKK